MTTLVLSDLRRDQALQPVRCPEFRTSTLIAALVHTTDEHERDAIIAEINARKGKPE